jgi:hypothetical protein
MDKKDNQDKNNSENKKEQNKTFPPLSIDLLAGIHNCLTVAINRKVYTEEEIKIIAPMYQHFSLGLEGMVREFKKQNPELMEKIQKEAMEHEQKMNKLETINEDNENNQEKIQTSDLKNGCDEDDIQG